jgi:predicted esterase YcpF (UPF0227 family)
MKILYLHGIGSGAESNTACQLIEYFKNTDVQVIAPELPVKPKEAFDYIQTIQKQEKPNIVIGTSLGGLYARFLHGPIKILVNPVLNAEDIVKAVGYGTHNFVTTRTDNSLVYEIDNVFISQLSELIAEQSKFVDDELENETYGLFGTQDSVVSNYNAYVALYGGKQFYQISAEHRLSNKNIQEELIPLVNYLRSKYEIN